MQSDGCGTCGVYFQRNPGTNMDAMARITARTRTAFENLEKCTIHQLMRASEAPRHLAFRMKQDRHRGVLCTSLDRLSHAFMRLRANAISTTKATTTAAIMIVAAPLSN